MRQTPNSRIDKYRRIHPSLGDSEKGENYGFFIYEREGHALRIIASDGLFGEKWEHVSVSLEDRCPTWNEMCAVKDLFWGPDETVLQFHPPESEYVNFHPNTLHLWRLRGFKQPRPRIDLV